MTGRELTKLAKQTIVPYLSEKGFVWRGFEGSNYEIFKESENLDRFCGYGRYLSRSTGTAIKLPVYNLFIYKFNKILNDTLEKHSIKGCEATFFAYTISDDELALRRKVSDHRIYDNTSFMIWVDNFQIHWENYVEPFFSNFLSVREIDKKLENLENEDKWQNVGGYPLLMKLMIYKFASNPKYREYSEWYLQHHETYKTLEGGVYFNYCLAALELYEKLESGMFDGVVM
jgi:hypothetical protein